jgi:hypothetical protein
MVVFLTKNQLLAAWRETDKKFLLHCWLVCLQYNLESGAEGIHCRSLESVAPSSLKCVYPPGDPPLSLPNDIKALQRHHLLLQVQEGGRGGTCTDF